MKSDPRVMLRYSNTLEMDILDLYDTECDRSELDLLVLESTG